VRQGDVLGVCSRASGLAHFRIVHVTLRPQRKVTTHFTGLEAGQGLRSYDLAENSKGWLGREKQWLAFRQGLICRRCCQRFTDRFPLSDKQTGAARSASNAAGQAVTGFLVGYILAINLAEGREQVSHFGMSEKDGKCFSEAKPPSRWIVQRQSLCRLSGNEGNPDVGTLPAG